MTLSPRDHAVIETVTRFRQVSARQIERLHFADGSPASRGVRTRRVLARLVSSGYLGRLERSVGGTGGGAEGYVYTVRNARVREINRHALDVSELYVRLVEAGAEIKEFTAEDTGRLKPDAYIWVGAYDYYGEIDRGTEYKPQLKRQIAAYSKAYARASESFPQVVWIVTFAPANKVRERIHFIRSITRHEPVPELFEVLTLEQAVTKIAASS